MGGINNTRCKNRLLLILLGITKRWPLKSSTNPGSKVQWCCTIVEESIRTDQGYESQEEETVIDEYSVEHVHADRNSCNSNDDSEGEEQPRDRLHRRY